MSVAVQVVNGREAGAEDDEPQAQAQAPQAQAQPAAHTTDSPSSPKEGDQVMSDGEEPTDAPRRKKFKPWKSIRNLFKRKKSSKGSEGEGEPAGVTNKSKSKSTGELDNELLAEGELNKRISMSEDSVFSPDTPAPTKEEVRTSANLNTSDFADELVAKFKERASSDDGFPQSGEEAMTTSEAISDNLETAPSDSSKTDSGIITVEDEPRSLAAPKITTRRWKSFTTGAKDYSQHAMPEMKRLRSENPGDVDLDLIQGSRLLSSSAAKHRISVAPSNRRPSRKARPRTPQKRSSGGRLDDVPSPIAEEPTPKKGSEPSPHNLDNKEKTDAPKDEEKDVPVVIINAPVPDEEEHPRTPSPDVLEDLKVNLSTEDISADNETSKEKEEKRAAPPISPKPGKAPAKTAEDVGESTPAPKEETTSTEPDSTSGGEDGEERRLSVAASKALFEAKMPTTETKKISPSPSMENNALTNGIHAKPSEPEPVYNSEEPTTEEKKEEEAPVEAETKAEADKKTTEKEKAEEEKAEKDKSAPVTKMEEKEEEEEKKPDEEEEEEQPISLKDRISRYQNLANKGSLKTSQVPKGSPTKQRPASTSNIENSKMDSPKKVAPKVLSKPSSTSSSKPNSTATTTDTSKPSTNNAPSKIPVPVSSSSLSSSRKPLQPKIDRCMVCDKAVYQNEMSKVEGRIFHRTCQKCSECNRTLTLWNIDIAEDKLYCKQHGTVVKNNLLKERLIIQ